MGNCKVYSQHRSYSQLVRGLSLATFSLHWRMLCVLLGQWTIPACISIVLLSCFLVMPEWEVKEGSYTQFLLCWLFLQLCAWGWPAIWAHSPCPERAEALPVLGAVWFIFICAKEKGDSSLKTRGAATGAVLWLITQPKSEDLVRKFGIGLLPALALHQSLHHPVIICLRNKLELTWKSVLERIVLPVFLWINRQH